MPIQVARLRRWFALAAIAMVLIVAGTYFYARHRVRNALKEVPAKIGLDVQQTAQGFTVSRSEEGRTIFKVQASKAIQFKQGGRTELHEVTITLYGRDSSRYDQIYGADFEYDPQSGDVVGKGDVQIDLEANPAGMLTHDQTPPKELKNPIHLKTRDLVFNQKTGDAYTNAPVDFSIPQAYGAAVGVSYRAKTNVLTLHSDVNVEFRGANPAKLTAVRGVITKDPRRVVLDDPTMVSGREKTRAKEATLFLYADNTISKVVASGGVETQTEGLQPMQAHADQLELLMRGQNQLDHAILSGGVQVSRSGPQPAEGMAGRVVLDFVGKNVITKAHALENVRLVQHQQGGQSGAQDLEITAPAMDFMVANGQHLRSAETAGPGPQIAIRPAAPNAGTQTLVTAGRFEANFDKRGQLASVHGAPDARITTTAPGQPDRISSSQVIDAAFTPGKGIESIAQQGNVAYVDGERKAWGERARYTTADRTLTLTGSPRFVEGGMTTTALRMRLNRATGDAYADGDVKSTYSNLKAQPNGALLASSSPIHVTARSMTAHRTPAVADYSGDAKLWQDANIVAAPTVEFDRDRRSVVAQGSPAQTVSTVIVQVDKAGRAMSVAITSSRLTYTDSERKAHFQGGVVAKGADVTMSAAEMDVYLKPRVGASGSELNGAGRLEKIVAQGNVVVSQPDRRATGGRLVYTADEDKFVMTGESPSIFDAEHGKITGVSLTFFRHDDRVLVEGSGSQPTVTQTRVAR